MTFHKSLTTVTPLSKAIAMILFIALPFLGFYAGMQYQEIIDLQNTQEVIDDPSAINHPAPSQSQDSTANWKTYTNIVYGFSVQHPNLDNSCCNIAGPISNTAQRIVVFANKSQTLEGTDKPFDGFGFYVDSNPQKLSLDKYVDNEKKLFSKEFGESTKQQPYNPRQESILVNGTSGISLKDYDIWRIERIYLPLSNNNEILIIVKANESPESFDKSFSQILSTFTFD